MKLTADSLDSHLAKQLAHAYLISGDEPLLVNEAADAVRAAARARGFTERDVHFIDRGVSWDDLRASAANLSLFAARRIVELRMPNGKPGVAGSAAIVDLVSRKDPDVLVLILTGRLERDAQSAAWVKAVDQHGAWLPLWPIEAARLPAWVRARARAAGINLDESAAQLLAERTEGNLLAAHQELERLRLVVGSGNVTEAEVAASVADSARFDVFRLGEAALAGDAPRALRIVSGLQAEGVEPTLVLWALLREVRNVWARREAAPGSRGAYVRQSAALDRAARRHSRESFAPLIERASRADRMIKGQLRGNAWDEISLLAAEFCGIRAVGAPTGATAAG